MNPIDPARIASIFRTLTNDGKVSTDRKNNTASELSDAGSSKKIQPHNKNILRQRLQNRLKKLQAESGDFSELAPEITIKEVLIWEFGDNILNHPEFSSIAKKVVKTIQASENTSFHLNNLIQQLIEK